LNGQNQLKHGSNKPSTTWTQDANHWDSAIVYGLTLPKVVVDNPHTRSLGIANTPIHEVRLFQVLHQQELNWALRLVAHGKFAAAEMFKLVKEAMLFSRVAKLMKDRNVDLEVLCKHFIEEGSSSSNPVHAVAESIVDHLRGIIPSSSTDPSILQRLKELEEENARLRTSRSHTSPKAPPLPIHSSPIARALRADSGKGSTRESIASEDPATVVQKVTCAGRNRVLATQCPKGHKGADVTAWIAKPPVGKHKKQIETLSKELLSFISKLPAAEQPNLSDLAAEWGLTTSTATKMDRNQLARVITAAHCLSE
jgi:hypothetical protein